MIKTRLLGLCLAGMLGSAPAYALWSAPTADQALTAMGRAVEVDVLANDTGVLKPKSLRVDRAPSHGEAQIVGLTIVYTPVAGFVGRDSFDYRVTGTRGSGVATVVVDVREPLVLRGRVVDGPLGVASIVATVDGEEFDTQADANGEYVLEILLQNEGMVNLDAAGIGAQAHIRLQAVVGDSSRLRAEAGSDGVLTREENNQVQVTSLSTAQARLLRAASAGALIGDDAALAAARDRLDYTQLLTQAGAVRLVARDGYSLPTGIADTVALISYPSALDAFLETVQDDNLSALPSAIAAVVSDREVLVPGSASELIGGFALVTDLGTLGAINGRYLQGTRFTLEPMGGSVASALPNPDPSVNWSFDGAVADIVPNSPLSQESTRFHPTLGSIRVISTPEHYRLGKLFEGGGRDTFALTQFTREVFPDHPQLPPATRTVNIAQMAIYDDGGIQPLNANDVPSNRTLWVPGPYTLLPAGSSGGSELFSLYMDGTGTRESGAALTWHLDADGRLVVALANGDQGIFRKAHDDGRGGTGLLGEWRSAAGARSARYQNSAFAGPLALEYGTAQRSWRSGFGLGDSAIAPGDDLVFVLDPDRIAWQRLASATSTTVTPVGWRVANGVLDIVSYRDGSNQPVHECPPEDTGCRIAMIRRWRSVYLRSDRVYMIEEFYQDLDGNGSLELTQQRTNFYDEIPRPPL